MYAGGSQAQRALLAKAAGSYGEAEGPPGPVRRPNFGMYPETDFWNRDMSLYFDIEPGLETAGAQVNSAYAGGLRRGFGVTPGQAGATVGTVVGGPVGTVVGSIAGSLFKASAAGPNKDAAAALYPLAQDGNLAAIAVFQNRATLQTTTSAAPWKAGLAQLQGSLPWAEVQRQLAAAVAAGRLPDGGWWKYDPGELYGVVQRYNVYLSGGSLAGAGSSGTSVIPGAGGVPGSPNQVTNGQVVQMAGFGGSTGLLLGLGLLGAFFALRPGRGRRRRR